MKVTELQPNQLRRLPNGHLERVKRCKEVCEAIMQRAVRTTGCTREAYASGAVRCVLNQVAKERPDLDIYNIDTGWTHVVNGKISIEPMNPVNPTGASAWFDCLDIAVGFYTDFSTGKTKLAELVTVFIPGTEKFVDSYRW